MHVLSLTLIKTLMLMNTDYVPNGFVWLSYCASTILGFAESRSDNLTLYVIDQNWKFGEDLLIVADRKVTTK